MKKPSVPYRLFCALTAFTVLLSLCIPSGLHAGDLAGLCNIQMVEHNAISMAEADHCDLAVNHETEQHDAMSTDTHTDAGDCPLDFTCCSIGKTAVKANAIPSLSKMFAGYIPVLVQILDNTPDPEYVKSSEQIVASLYSPPLFLKNSSFLN